MVKSILSVADRLWLSLSQGTLMILFRHRSQIVVFSGNCICKDTIILQLIRR